MITAQELFKHVMRDLVAPSLRAMGFRGGHTRTFWIKQGDYSSNLYTQKNRYSTKTEVDFWIHLNAFHQPTGRCYWWKELHWLVPGVTAGGWTVEVGSPLEPVAESMIDGIRRYGLPAMQAAIDSPGFPPDPGDEWPRTFPRPGDNVGDGPPDLGEIAWVLRPLNQDADQWLTMLADESVARRMQALRRLFDLEDDDPRAGAALSDRQERDPSRRVRRYAADLLTLPPSDDGERPPALDEIAWVLRPAGKRADQWFAKLDDENDASRMDALNMITRKAPKDSRTLPVLLDRLEHDPSHHVRMDAADLLVPRARDESIRQALQDAAAQDEDLQVRWAARYAIRLAAADETWTPLS